MGGVFATPVANLRHFGLCHPTGSASTDCTLPVEAVNKLPRGLLEGVFFLASLKQHVNLCSHGAENRGTEGRCSPNAFLLRLWLIKLLSELSKILFSLLYVWTSYVL